MTNWNELEHAYGPATDMPELLVSLETGNRKAIGPIADRIAHQGWASTDVATATVPHLWRIATEVEAVRGGVAMLLGDLACMGDHMHFMAGGFGRDDMADGMLREPNYAKLRATVVAQAETAISWLDEKDKTTRSGTALLLAVTQPEGALERLQTAASKERSKVTRSDLYTALGWFEAPDLDLLRKGLGRKTADRFGAAVALAMRDQLDDDVVAALVAPETMNGSAWAAGDHNGHGLRVLIAACGRSGDPTPLYDAIGKMERLGRTKAVAELIKIEFADEVAEHRYDRKGDLPTPKLDSLSNPQHDLLVMISGLDSGWGRSDQSYWLEYLGFWNNPIQLRAYLGIPEATTLLDEPSELGDEPMTWRERLVGDLEAGKDPKALAQAVAASTTPENAVTLATLVRRNAFNAIKASRVFRIYLLVELNRPDLLRAHIQELCDRGRWVTYWRCTEDGMYFNQSDDTIEDDFFVALKQLEPDAKWPDGLRIDHHNRNKDYQALVDSVGEEITGWLSAAFT